MTRALDSFDPAADAGHNLTKAFEPIAAKFLVVSFTSDWRFSVNRSREIVDALIASGKNVASAIIDSPHGHDSFLLSLDRYLTVLRTYLKRIHQEVG